MPRDAAVYRIRRFRLALVTIIGWEWIVVLVSVPFVGRWPLSLSTTLIVLARDGLLTILAWRRPWGFATIVLIGLHTLWAALEATTGHGVGALLLTIVDGASAVLLVALLVSLWGDMREERAVKHDLMRSIDLLDRHDARTILRKRRMRQRVPGDETT